MSDRFVSSRYRGMASTPMSSSVDRATRFDDVVNFSLGDPDLTTDPRIIDAAAADAHAGHTHYTDTFGDPELREEILAFYRQEYGYQPDPRELLVTTSGCHAMWLALESILDDGDEVVICEPYFTPYPHQIRLARGVPVVLSTLESEEFQVVPSRLEAVITPRTRAIILNTPANPTGSCLSRATKEAVARIAAEHDLIVIADEIYTLFSYGEEFEPFAMLPGMSERTITIGSFSKDFAMTGWRIGYVLAPPAVTMAMKDVNENNVFTAPSISQRAALHALRLREQIQPPMRALYRERLMHAYQRVCDMPGMSAIEPKGSIYLWVNITATGLSSDQVAERLFDEAHVLTIPGPAFGAGCEGYLRLAMTVGVEKIDEAFDRIARMDLFGGSPQR
ncbi:aminotransferase class I/II-fold pyridoxal phosphate-dependent enzyme [Gephyromycinifex aptenodytis]|uniref:aminotransferase class I/II-fold pyridoxal phosphate-dependent enzyme n=1 Tax=Gephyromycinifex aptenodytis TaxID=2716227 RepID=UPI001447045A|nr:aminotransferase class I/II-fold pyridoxal phosphate-dependent enzyme [Gephyromycinifex aptenodytis]